MVEFHITFSFMWPYTEEGIFYTRCLYGTQVWYGCPNYKPGPAICGLTCYQWARNSASETDDDLFEYMTNDIRHLATTVFTQLLGHIISIQYTSAFTIATVDTHTVHVQQIQIMDKDRHKWPKEHLRASCWDPWYHWANRIALYDTVHCMSAVFGQEKCPSVCTDSLCILMLHNSQQLVLDRQKRESKKYVRDKEASECPTQMGKLHEATVSYYW